MSDESEHYQEIDEERHLERGTASRARNEARAIRREMLRKEREKEALQEQMKLTLGDELVAALGRYLAGRPDRAMPLQRFMGIVGYSDELRRLIVRSIALNPIMEPTFLKIAELAFEDGREARAEEDFDYRFED